mgnify:CR=1 FL=1
MIRYCLMLCALPKAVQPFVAALLDEEIEVHAENSDNANASNSVIGIDNALIAPAVYNAQLVHIRQ